MMYNTYNMGIGMVLCVDLADVDKTMQALSAAGERAYLIGETFAGEKEAIIC
jgi:phosphoribosylformylglycinamidine cyclo-ligase